MDRDAHVTGVSRHAMPTTRPRVRPVVWALLIVSVAWGTTVWWQRAHRESRALAYTVCPLWGEPRVVLLPGIEARDAAPVRVHEREHLAQCRSLGPVAYRLRNLTARGKLSLEAPAYCAAARIRLAVDPDSEFVSDLLYTDMIEGLSDVADSTAVKASLMATCPSIASKPRRTRKPPTRSD